MEKPDKKEITRRLDLIIVLLMKFVDKDNEDPLMKKVKYLHELGFVNEEIGIYLSKDKKQVAKLLYENKRKSTRTSK